MSDWSVGGAYGLKTVLWTYNTTTTGLLQCMTTIATIFVIRPTSVRVWHKADFKVVLAAGP